MKTKRLYWTPAILPLPLTKTKLKFPHIHIRCQLNDSQYKINLKKVFLSLPFSRTWLSLLILWKQNFIFKYFTFLLIAFHDFKKLLICHWDRIESFRILQLLIFSCNWELMKIHGFWCRQRKVEVIVLYFELQKQKVTQSPECSWKKIVDSLKFDICV